MATIPNPVPYLENPMTTAGDIIIEDSTPAAERLAIGTAGEVLTVATSSGLPSWSAAAAGSGTVTDVSVVSSNGLSGTVADATTTPEITLSTTITGILKGSMGAMVSATAGTDYLTPTGSAAALTGFPTFNQNTTGSANTAGTAFYATTAGTAVYATNAGTAVYATSSGNFSGGATLPDYLAPKVVTLTDAGTVSVNSSLGNDFRLSMGTAVGAARTMGTPSSAVDGERITFQLAQAASGGPFTVTWSSAWDVGAAGAPSLSTAASKVDVVGWIYNSNLSKWVCVGSAFGF